MGLIYMRWSCGKLMFSTFRLKRRKGHAAAGQLFGYLLKVRHPAQRYMLLLLRKQQPLQVRICFHIQRPGEIGCTGPLQDSCNGISGAAAALCDAPLADPLAVEPQDLTILGHMMTSR